MLLIQVDDVLLLCLDCSCLLSWMSCWSGCWLTSLLTMWRQPRLLSENWMWNVKDLVNIAIWLWNLAIQSVMSFTLIYTTVSRYYLIPVGWMLYKVCVVVWFFALTYI